LASKQARLDDNFTRVNVSAGSHELFRTTIDTNHEIEQIEGAALRVNILAHDQNIPGRDYVYNNRYGVDTSLAFGLDEGSDTRLFLNLFYQKEDNLSDYGIPFVENNATGVGLFPGHVGLPAPVNYDNFYGLVDRDFEDTDVARFTARFEHDINEAVTIRNQTRIGRSNRFSLATAPRFNAANPGVITRNFQDRDEVIDLFISQSDLLFKFDTGDWEHEAILGMEVAREDYFRRRLSSVGTVNTADPFNPDPFNSPTPSYIPNGNFSEAQMLSTSVYLFDTIEVTPWLDITGGARFDRIDIDIAT